MTLPQHKCQLVIDSACDLPHEVVESLGVDMMLFPYEMNDGEHIDDFGQSMSSEDFYGRLIDGDVSRTAQIPIPVMTEKFRHAAETKTPTVFLCLSSGLTGTYDTMCRVADEVREEFPEAEIYVVDTLLASIAEGFLVLEAVKQRNNGLTAAELAAWAEEARYYVHGYFTVDDLMYLRRGGRIPPIAAAAGSKLDIKPVLKFDLTGHLAIDGLVRGRKKSVKSVAKLLNENAIEPDRAQIVFGNAVCEKDMRSLEGMYSGPKALFVETSIGPVIGSHVGPGMVAASFWGPDRRKEASFGDRIAKNVKKRNSPPFPK
ncbi:MAG: DegV family protein [Coriobacteriales bacterium]|jgi:DegV family protein with EDD domain